MSWQKLQSNPEYKKNVELRSILTRSIREFFWSRDFLEVETPIMLRAPGQEPYLHPFSTRVIDGEGKEYIGYLHTSPEYAMKKMLVGGFTKIFQICKTFRNRENFGGLHNPEFTMIEWYRAHADYTALMDDIEHLVSYLSNVILEQSDRIVPALGKDSISRMHSFQNDKWERVTMRQLWQRHLNVDLNDVLTTDAMIAYSRTLGFPTKDDETYEDAFFRIFLNRIEPYITEPTMVYDYPVQMASLSRVKQDDPRYAERIEAYLGGMEIANGFSELTNADEQLKRLEEERALRGRLGHEVFDVDQDFIAALRAGMPPSAGIALGVDRVIMALLGVTRIEDVLPFPAKELWSA